MGNWNSIQQEIDSLNRPEASDIVRRQKINAVQRLTGRHLLIYAVMLTFAKTAAYKIVENSNHDALIGTVQVNVQPVPLQQPPEQSRQNSRITLPRNKQEERRQLASNKRRRR